MDRRVWCGAFLMAVGCRKVATLPIYGTVPRFQLTTQDGAPFDSHSLDGKLWLASFFFASCTGPCPRINTQIYALQESTYTYPDLRILSFTVDPEHDTPPVLAAYAKRYKADPQRWTFLTGPRATISKLSKDGFQVGELDDANSHSTRIMLVDGRSRVRGHYPAIEAESLDALQKGIASIYQAG
ncbi:MAG TPA: SCO family protein [Bryobacteraceae bacterium]|nr:SCO family protein [Bryobacteraceae bacterium]